MESIADVADPKESHMTNIAISVLVCKSPISDYAQTNKLKQRLTITQKLLRLPDTLKNSVNDLGA